MQTNPPRCDHNIEIRNHACIVCLIPKAAKLNDVELADIAQILGGSIDHDILDVWKSTVAHLHGDVVADLMECVCQFIISNVFTTSSGDDTNLKSEHLRIVFAKDLIKFIVDQAQRRDKLLDQLYSALGSLFWRILDKWKRVLGEETKTDNGLLISISTLASSFTELLELDNHHHLESGLVQLVDSILLPYSPNQNALVTTLQVVDQLLSRLMKSTTVATKRPARGLARKLVSSSIIPLSLLLKPLASSSSIWEKFVISCLQILGVVKESLTVSDTKDLSSLHLTQFLAQTPNSMIEFDSHMEYLLLAISFVGVVYRDRYISNSECLKFIGSYLVSHRRNLEVADVYSFSHVLYFWMKSEILYSHGSAVAEYSKLLTIFGNLINSTSTTAADWIRAVFSQPCEIAFMKWFWNAASRSFGWMECVKSLTVRWLSWRVGQTDMGISLIDTARIIFSDNSAVVVMLAILKTHQPQHDDAKILNACLTIMSEGLPSLIQNQDYVSLRNAMEKMMGETWAALMGWIATEQVASPSWPPMIGCMKTILEFGPPTLEMINLQPILLKLLCCTENSANTEQVHGIVNVLVLCLHTHRKEEVVNRMVSMPTFIERLTEWSLVAANDDLPLVAAKASAALFIATLIDTLRYLNNSSLQDILTNTDLLETASKFIPSTRPNRKLWTIIHRIVAVNFKVLNSIETPQDCLKPRAFMLMNIVWDASRNRVVEAFTQNYAVDDLTPSTALEAMRSLISYMSDHLPAHGACLVNNPANRFVMDFMLSFYYTVTSVRSSENKSLQPERLMIQCLHMYVLADAPWIKRILAEDGPWLSKLLSSFEEVEDVKTRRLYIALFASMKEKVILTGLIQMRLEPLMTVNEDDDGSPDKLVALSTGYTMPILFPVFA
ncbi:hypothetical protein SeMB42_g01916 [Synchytrium endobioticum]|uniref:Uncharacterized protein n=1 Tax=Synchytrium endobioticum TaxID=286115 RepID=A0A507DKM3_9FUNG|nr:hypothetical protein SeLEV6574_g01930 [Synchytrium endobioticum]TPX51430.1 hypothetical protein SeMB42_g01916 [Synchytrium endobioticum]